MLSEAAPETMPVFLEAEPTEEKDVIPEFPTSGDIVDDPKCAGTLCETLVLSDPVRDI